MATQTPWLLKTTSAEFALSGDFSAVSGTAKTTSALLVNYNTVSSNAEAAKTFTDSHTGKLTIQNNGTVVLSNWDGTSSSSINITAAEGNISITGENGISASFEDDAWHIGISAEDSELTAGSGINITADGSNTKIELNLSAGEGIGFNVANNLVTISANSQGGMTTVSANAPLSGTGTNDSPLGLDTNEMYELSGTGSVTVTAMDGKLVISGDIAKASDSYLQLATSDKFNSIAVSADTSAFVLGEGLLPSWPGALIGGSYNKPYTNSKVLLEIGGGKSDTDRANAFAVLSDATLVAGDNNTLVNNKYGLCVGDDAEIQDNSYFTMLGSSNKLSASNFTFVNGNANSGRSSDYNIVNGQINRLTNINYAMLIGNNNAMSAENETSVYSVIYGNSNRVGGQFNYIYGNANTAMGGYNEVLGADNFCVNGNLNFVVGSANSAQASNQAMLLGRANKSTYDGSILMGLGLTATAPMQIIMGAKNDVNDKITSRYDITSPYYNTFADGVTPMFVLAGDSEGSKNSHTIYKDGRMMLRFDQPSYGAGGSYDQVDEVLLDYQHFVDTSASIDAVRTYSGYFAEISAGTNVNINQSTALDGHRITTISARADVDYSQLAKYIVVSADESESNAISVVPHTDEGKITYVISGKEGGVSTEYIGESGIYVENSRIGISADTYEELTHPTELYYKDNNSYDRYMYRADNSEINLLNSVAINGAVRVQGGGSYRSSDHWQYMIKPISGDLLTQQSINTGLKIQIVSTKPESPDANTIYLVKEAST